MRQSKEYVIPFAGLKLGKHQFDFEVGQAFFDSFGYDEFNDASIDLQVLFEKMSTVMEVLIKASGVVNVNCDLTNEPFDQPIEAALELVIKFGEEFNNEDDEILILPHGESQVDLSQYIYEMLVLAVPTKRVHPGVLDGSLGSDVLEKLEELSPKEIKKEKEDTDPRWDALKDLLTDKKK